MRSDASAVVLRPPDEPDATAIANAVQASLAELAPWMPWASEAYGAPDALQWIRGEFGEAHRFVIVDASGDIVGSCGLNGVDEGNNSANLGYWVRSDRTGRGTATAATCLLAEFGTGEAGYHRLEVTMSVHNIASRRVAEKAGAHYEGIARGRLLLRGDYHDAHTFSFIKGDVNGRSPRRR